MACLTQQPPPVTGCVKVAAVARTHTLLCHALWVARSTAQIKPCSCRSSRCCPLLFLAWWRKRTFRPSPSWSPLLGGRQTAALPVWTFCGAQRPKKTATLVPSRWSFARKHVLDTSLEQYVGRLSHDRTTERHWQRLGSHRATVPKEVPRGSSTPATAHATSPGAVAVRLSSVPFFGGAGGLSLGPLPPRAACRRHRRIATTAQYRRRCARRLGLVGPWDPSWCPVTPSFGGPPAAGRQRVFSWVASSRVVKSHLGSPDVVCHCRGTGDRGLFAPQSSCPGSSRRQESHLPCTSTGLLR